MTYLLLVFNLIVFGLTMQSAEKTDSQIDKIMADDQFQETQGVLFAQLILQHPEAYGESLAALAEKALSADMDARDELGSLAVHNELFMSQAEKMNFKGDEVAIKAWRKNFTDLLNAQDEDPTYRFGLTARHSGPIQWFTYQFAHSGFEHLFWNMIFMLIFGCFIETELGGSVVILAYVGGGLAAAWMFSTLSGFSAAPVVGASGAISSLMGLVAFHWWGRDKIRYFYFLLFRRGYVGLMFLPSWLVFLCYLLPDLGGYLASSPHLGGFAYSAHLGGSVFGGVMALAFKYGLLVKDTADLDDDFDDDLDDDIEREEREKRDDDRRAG